MRYAEPPTGSLRFRKPRPAPSWVGKRDALTAGNACSQYNFLTGSFYNIDYNIFMSAIVNYEHVSLYNLFAMFQEGWNDINYWLLLACVPMNVLSLGCT